MKVKLNEKYNVSVKGYSTDIELILEDAELVKYEVLEDGTGNISFKKPGDGGRILNYTFPLRWTKLTEITE